MLLVYVLPNYIKRLDAELTDHPGGNHITYYYFSDQGNYNATRRK